LNTRDSKVTITEEVEEYLGSKETVFGQQI